VTEITLSEIVQITQVLMFIIGLVAFYREYRKMAMDRGYNTYLQTVFSFIDLEKMCLQHPELLSIWEYDDEYKGLTRESRMKYMWFDILLSILEIDYLASPKYRKWLSEEEWKGWENSFLIYPEAQNSV